MIGFFRLDERRVFSARTGVSRTFCTVHEDRKPENTPIAKNNNSMPSFARLVVVEAKGGR